MRRPAWAVGSYSTGQSAGGTSQNIIFRTLRQIGRPALYISPCWLVSSVKACYQCHWRSMRTMTHDLVEGARVPHRPQRGRGRRAELRGLLPPHPRRRHHSGQKEEEAEEAEETAGSGGRDFSLQRHGSCIGVGRYDGIGILYQAKDSELLTIMIVTRFLDLIARNNRFQSIIGTMDCLWQVSAVLHRPEFGSRL